MNTEFWQDLGIALLVGLETYLWMWFIVWDYEQRAKEVGRELYKDKETE